MSMLVDAYRFGSVAPWDGFPEILGTTSYGAASSTNVHAIAIPAGGSGDLLLLHIVHSTSTSLTVPSGWTSLSASVNNVFGGPRSSWIYRVANGSEGSTLNFNTSNLTTCVAVMRRIKVGTFQSVPELTSAASTAASTTPNPPNLAPSWGSAKSLWIAAYGATPTVATSVYPLPDNQRTDSGTAVTNPLTIGSCTKKDEVSSLDPGSFTIGSSLGTVVQTVAIRPA